MQTLAKQAEQPTVIPVRRSLVARMRYRVATILGAVAFLVAGSVGVASASSTDPLNGGGDQIFSSLTSYLQGHLSTLVFGLALVAIAIGLVLRWVRKAVHA